MKEAYRNRGKLGNEARPPLPVEINKVVPLGIGTQVSSGKESAWQWSAVQSSDGGRSPGEGNGYLLQYYCLKISMAREAWLAI